MDPTIAQRVIDIAGEKADQPREAITPASHFQNDLNFDSLDAVEFAMALEEEFEISVPDEVIPTLQTVEQAIQHVQREISKAPAKS